MSNGTQELVTIIPWTFIAQILNLFIQVYLIKRFLFKPINEVLEKRRQMADQEIKEAREAKEAADSLKVRRGAGRCESGSCTDRAERPEGSSDQSG